MRTVPVPSPVAELTPTPVVTAEAPPPVEALPAATPEQLDVVAVSSLAPTGTADELDAEEDEDDGEPSADEGEDHTVVETAVPGGPLYSADVSDELLEQLWRNEPEKLGSMSVGFVDAGRLVNGAKFPRDEAWLVVSPETTWGTHESVEQLTTAIRRVRELHPNAPPLRVNEMSAKDGGYLRPHKSHQNGRDVDLGFYYPTVDPIRVREREKVIDVALNWALVKSLIIHTDVQFILVDKRVIQVLYEHALASGEDKTWLDSIFRSGASSLVKHARRHRDHFHVRFLNGRAQELGRRVAPLLALQPEHNIAHHRVRSGDTLGAIALRYGSTVSMLKKANRIKGHMLRIGQRLAIPLRGPCTKCPVPAPMVLPPRRLPPAAAVASTIEQAEEFDGVQTVSAMESSTDSASAAEPPTDDVARSPAGVSAAP